jgi:hypothetical protein
MKKLLVAIAILVLGVLPGYGQVPQGQVLARLSHQTVE